MKEKHSDQGKTKHNGEDWMSIARSFGEECVKIQQDSKLSIDQKLEKQKTLSNRMIKEIEVSSDLSNDDKQQMIESIHHYMHEWKTMHDLAQQGGRR